MVHIGGTPFDIEEVARPAAAGRRRHPRLHRLAARHPRPTPGGRARPPARRASAAFASTSATAPAASRGRSRRPRWPTASGPTPSAPTSIASTSRSPSTTSRRRCRSSCCSGCPLDEVVAMATTAPAAALGRPARRHASPSALRRTSRCCGIEEGGSTSSTRPATFARPASRLVPVGVGPGRVRMPMPGRPWSGPPGGSARADRARSGPTRRCGTSRRGSRRPGRRATRGTGSPSSGPGRGPPSGP